MILIITEFEEDPTVLHLSKMLRTQSAEVVIIALSTLEHLSSFFIGNDLNSEVGARSVLRLADRVIDLREVRSVFLWRNWSPDPLLEQFRGLFEQRRDEWDFFERQWAAFHKGFAMTLAYHHHVFCVNPPPWNTAFEEKCCQLAIAADVGLRIPPTLYSTRLSLVREFYEEHGGSIIYKPFRPFIRVVRDQENHVVSAQALYTNRVNIEDLIEPEGFMPTPGIFQPYIAKQIELRIVVVGKQLLTCAIHSQSSERDRDDWRHYDLEHTTYTPYELPSDIAQKIFCFMDRLRLVFGSIDMIVTPQGDYVFLEINPNGQIDFIARLADLPIYEHLAAMLLARSVDYSVTMFDERQKVLYAD